MAELQTQSGSDPVLKMMLSRGLPLDRETYLAFSYPDNMPNPWTAEHESELPEPFQQPQE